MNEREARQGKEEDRVELFAAANSGRGFYSYYPQIFERQEIEKRYLIKGGPGTGKSSLLRMVAREAEKAGKEVEYYRCSSDPDSLDGLILNGRIALLDATAPHSEEPTLPGVRDEIVNLGSFWNAEALETKGAEVEAIASQKGESYRKAYRFLSAAMEVEEINRSLTERRILWDKMERAAARLMRDQPSGTGFGATPCLVDGLTMKGAVRLKGYDAKAERVVAVEDFLGLGSVFLSFVIQEAKKKGLRICVPYQPLCPTLPCGVFLEETSCLFLLDWKGEEPQKRIHMKRFIAPEDARQIRGEYRRNKHLAAGLIQAATDSLAEAGRHHFELERIYASCMDFEAEQRFFQTFCRRLLERL